MSEVLLFIAYTAGVVSVLWTGWAALCFEVPRMMTVALAWSELSLVYGIAGEAVQGSTWGAAWCGASLAVVAVLMWRTWPEDWNPGRDLRVGWRQIRRVISLNRIAENKEP